MITIDTIMSVHLHEGAHLPPALYPLGYEETARSLTPVVTFVVAVMLAIMKLVKK